MLRHSISNLRAGSALWWGAAALAVALLSQAGCVYTETSVCSVSEKICPTTYVCTADGMDCIAGLCGNGVLDPDEVCDDGNIRDGDSCSSDCLILMSCGNGVVEPEFDEVCDDGNNEDEDGCSQDCTSNETCGNGVLDLLVGEGCDDGNLVNDDGCDMNCRLETCGDGVLDLDNGEICDDGNEDAGDHCSPDCRIEPMMAAGADHSCALLDTGRVRCWGRGEYGQLGYGNPNTVGDDETPAEAGDIDLGGTAVQIAAGIYHTCAIMADGAVRCWGLGQNGRLGLGNTLDIGENEVPASVPPVDLGGVAVQIAGGREHTCALLDNGAVRCWGEGDLGRLGYGNINDIGDDETPASAGDVPLDEPAIKVQAGLRHTCALLESGALRCWGSGNLGQLGYPRLGALGDNELPTAVGPVMVGGKVIDVDLGNNHTCALLEGNTVRCWGNADVGQLGYGTRDRIGDDETPEVAGDVSVGGNAIAVIAGGNSSCALMGSDTGAPTGLRCWGWNDRGQLGLGHTDNIGDTEVPSTTDLISLGRTPVQVAMGVQHICAVLSNRGVRCWGLNGQGRLGNMILGNIGDDELPSSIPEVDVQ